MTYHITLQEMMEYTKFLTGRITQIDVFAPLDGITYETMKPRFARKCPECHERSFIDCLWINVAAPPGKILVQSCPNCGEVRLTSYSVEGKKLPFPTRRINVNNPGTLEEVQP